MRLENYHRIIESILANKPSEFQQEENCKQQQRTIQNWPSIHTPKTPAIAFVDDSAAKAGLFTQAFIRWFIKQYKIDMSEAIRKIH